MFVRFAAVVLLARLLDAAPAPAVEQAFARLYQFDFQGSHALLDNYVGQHPSEPLPYAVRASAYLFYELDRLGILESEFFSDDERIANKKKLKPDAGVRARLLAAVADVESRAAAVLAVQPNDRDALFAMSIAQGVFSDYVALVEKRQIASFSSIKRATSWGQRLLKVDPHFYDAYLGAGIAEYLLGSLPFFVRWFVRIDEIKGSKEEGIRNLQMVVERGRYLKPFAKILLGIVYLREKKPHLARNLLQELARDYPSNPLFRRELAKITAQAGGG